MSPNFTSVSLLLWMRFSHTTLMGKRKPVMVLVNSTDYQCKLCEIQGSYATFSDTAYGFKKLEILPVKRSFCPERDVAFILCIISLVIKVSLVVTTSATEAHGQNQNCVAEHTLPVPKARGKQLFPHNYRKGFPFNVPL